MLNTDVDTPHQGPVSCVAFANNTDDSNEPSMLVSVGATDSKFKLWTLDVNPFQKRKSTKHVPTPIHKYIVSFQVEDS